MKKLTREEAYEQANKVWKILEDAVGYGFNSSHAYSVALDSVYGAFLKAKYPLEYYAVVLNIYESNTKMTAKIMKELNHFNINVMPIRFGKSKARYSPDIKSNSIVKGIASIKFLNESVANELFELATEKQYTDFLDLIIDVEEKTSCNSRQMEILIKLNFFEQFGKNLTLLNIYNKFKERYKKAHKDKTKNLRIEEIKEFISEQEDKEIAVQPQLLFEKEILGYGQTTFPKLSKAFVMVVGVDTKYSPRVSLYIFNNGIEKELKVDYKFFYNQGEQLINYGDILKVLKVDRRPKKIKIDGKWVDGEDQEEWLAAWQMSKRYEEDK